MLGYHGYHTYYIQWASKFATSANKRADKRIYKTERTSEGTRPGQVRPPNSWRSWVDLSCVNDRCINTRFKAWWCARQSSDMFIASLTSSQSWAEASLSALSWDRRSRTDWGSGCTEVVSHLLVSSFNSLSSSRQDLGVISLSSRWFGSLSSLKFCLA